MPDGTRIGIVGNAGGGKSTLARQLAKDLQLPLLELDRILWRPDWQPAPEEAYRAAHARAISADSWIIEGLGHKESISERLRRATAIILIDMPIWMHFWLAAERQITWGKGCLEDPPAGATKPPPTKALFRTIFEVDRDWMPNIRALVDQEERQGKPIVRIETVDELRQGIDPVLISRHSARRDDRS